MFVPAKINNKAFMEIEYIDGIVIIRKEDKQSSKRVGKPIYVTKTLDEMIKDIKSGKTAIHF